MYVFRDRKVTIISFKLLKSKGIKNFFRDFWVIFMIALNWIMISYILIENIHVLFSALCNINRKFAYPCRINHRGVHEVEIGMHRSFTNARVWRQKTTSTSFLYTNSDENKVWSTRTYVKSIKCMRFRRLRLLNPHQNFALVLLGKVGPFRIPVV